MALLAGSLFYFEAKAGNQSLLERLQASASQAASHSGQNDVDALKQAVTDKLDQQFILMSTLEEKLADLNTRLSVLENLAFSENGVEAIQEFSDVPQSSQGLAATGEPHLNLTAPATPDRGETPSVVTGSLGRNV
jgi:hypothetical protein